MCARRRLALVIHEQVTFRALWQIRRIGSMRSVDRKLLVPKSF